MDFDKLHESYIGPDSPSVAGQIAWLQKKGIPSEIIDKAMLAVYDELSRGRVIKGTPEHSAGFMLDNVILGVAQKMIAKDVEARKQQLQTFLKDFRNKWENDLVELAKANGTNTALPSGSPAKAKATKYAKWILLAQALAAEALYLISQIWGS